MDKLSREYESVKRQEKEVEEKIKETERKFSEYEKSTFLILYSRFRVVTASVKQYEILYDIDLIIHVTSDDRQTMEDIFQNGYHMTALGRSEDFIAIESVDRVTLSTEYEEELSCDYSAYVNLLLWLCLYYRNYSIRLPFRILSRMILSVT